MSLRIHQPRIERLDKNDVRLVSCIEHDSTCNEVWFSVPECYSEYLCYERSDAFLIGMLNWAMRTGDDIECEAPVSEELLFQIREHLIPSLAKYDKTLRWIAIKAPIMGGGDFLVLERLERECHAGLIHCMFCSAMVPPMGIQDCSLLI